VQRHWLPSECGQTGPDPSTLAVVFYLVLAAGCIPCERVSCHVAQRHNNPVSANPFIESFKLQLKRETPTLKTRSAGHKARNLCHNAGPDAALYC
jgi:hypothetical protein